MSLRNALQMHIAFAETGDMRRMRYLPILQTNRFMHEA